MCYTIIVRRERDATLNRMEETPCAQGANVTKKTDRRTSFHLLHLGICVTKQESRGFFQNLLTFLTGGFTAKLK